MWNFMVLTCEEYDDKEKGMELAKQIVEVCAWV